MKYLDLSQFLIKKNVSETLFLKNIKERLSDNWFLTGSILNGHGTLTSDIDINVITLSPTVGQEISNIFESGIRLDIERIFIGTIIDFSCYLSDYKVTDSNSDFFSRDIDGIKLLELAQFTGRCLNTNFHNITGKKVANTISLLRKNKKNEAWLSSYYQMLAFSHIEDTVGFVTSEDYCAAYISSIEAMNYAFLAILNRNGIFCDRVKWVPFYLRHNNEKHYHFYKGYISSEPEENSILASINYIEKYLIEGNYGI